MNAFFRFVHAMISQPWAMEPAALTTLQRVVAQRIAREFRGEGESPMLRAWDDSDHDRGPPDWRSEQNHGGVAWFADPAREAAIPHQTANAVARRSGRVAVLPIRGVMSHRLGSMSEFSGGTSTERAMKSLDGLMADNDVKAVVLDIDSPGGTTDGIIEAAAHVYGYRNADKPLVAVANAMAASAAYWLGSQAQELSVTPSGSAGSIGVYSIHEDFTRALEAEGVGIEIIRSSQFKIEANPYEPLSAEGRAAVQADVNTFGGFFHDDVARGRGVKSARVAESFGQGRMVLAADAVKRGMADRIATLEDVLNRFGATAGGAGARSKAQDARSQVISARHALRRARISG